MATIKLTNDVKISSNSLMMHIDPSNILVNQNWGNPNNFTWTATADGWAKFYAANNTASFYIDNVKVAGVPNYVEAQPIFVKKGQVIKVTNSDTRVTTNNLTVYGLL